MLSQDVILLLSYNISFFLALSNINISTVDVLLSAGWQVRLSQWGADRNVRPCQPTCSAQICNLADSFLVWKYFSHKYSVPSYLSPFTKSNWLRRNSSNCSILNSAFFKGYLSHWRLSTPVTNQTNNKEVHWPDWAATQTTTSPDFVLSSSRGGVKDFLQNKL